MNNQSEEVKKGEDGSSDVDYPGTGEYDGSIIVTIRVTSIISSYITEYSILESKENPFILTPHWLYSEKGTNKFRN